MTFPETVLTLPSLELLIVPDAYRGPFGYYLGLLLPGLFFYALTVYALNPLFQIEKRTLPLIAAALIGCAANAALIKFLPHGNDAAVYAVAHAGALFAGFAALVLFALRAHPVWPDLRTLAVAIAAALTMTGVLLPMRGLVPGVLTFGAQIGAGLAIYSLFIFAFDLAGLRGRILRHLRPKAAP